MGRGTARKGGKGDTQKGRGRGQPEGEPGGNGEWDSQEGKEQPGGRGLVRFNFKSIKQAKKYYFH